MSLLVLLAASQHAQAQRGEPMQSERVTCSIYGALKFGLPVNVMLAVAEVEGGRPGQWVKNRNGSHDVGALQFNTRYLAYLERYGITAADVAAAGCYPYELAAWRLRRHLERDRGDSWTRLANYHSRSPAHNAKYRAKLVRKAEAWGRWLSTRYATYEVGDATERSAVARAGDVGIGAEAGGDEDVLALLGALGHDDGGTSAREASEPKGSRTGTSIALGADPSPLGFVARRLRTGSTRPSRASPAERLDTDHRPTYPFVTPKGRSLGSPHSGSLHGGMQVPQGRGYVLRDPSRAWGTPSSVAWLTQALDAMVARDSRAPRVRVHDMSLRGGGPMEGHKSHQSGRDVDLSYYQRGCIGACPARTVTPTTLDARRQWRLLSHWLQRAQVEFVFVDYRLQGPLYDAARAAGASAVELGRWFQYPRGREFPAGLIRHEPNHANHVHVRFRCLQGDRACQRTATRRVERRGAEAGGPLLELLEDEAEAELLELLR